MQTVDSYLKQVQRWVPIVHRQKILKQVREDLSELVGDADSPQDLMRKIKSFGKPQVVAARYAGFRHFIPGMLAPTYYVVLSVTTVFLFLLQITLILPRYLHDASWLSNIGTVFTATFASLPIVFTVITLVFAAIGHWVQRDTSGFEKVKS